MDSIDSFLEVALSMYESKGALKDVINNQEKIGQAGTKRRNASGPLRFPTKLASDEIGKRLFVSDNGNHKIVVYDSEGNLLEKIGSGEAGFIDGDFESASFKSPQGICYNSAKNQLLVAGKIQLIIIDFFSTFPS